MTDNRTNEPTPEQVEAAARALHETQNPWLEAHGDWGATGFEIKKAFRESARAALVAAQEAAPQAESSSTSRIINLAEKWADEKLGGYIARASFMRGVRFALNETVTPVLPSSGVDEDKLAKMERAAAEKAWDEGFSRGFYRGQIPSGDYDASEAGISNPYEEKNDE